MVLPDKSLMSVSGLNFLPPNIVLYMIFVERKGLSQKGEGRLESNDMINYWMKKGTIALHIAATIPRLAFLKAISHRAQGLPKTDSPKP